MKTSPFRIWKFDFKICAVLLFLLAMPILISPGSSARNHNEYVVIAQLNLWYYGPGCYGGFEAFDCSGARNTPLIPALGYTYLSSDPAVIEQQIEWATEYGVDAFSLEWTTPREIPGSLEENIDDAFLQAPNLHKIRWTIFYDFVLRLLQTPGLNVDISGGINFDNPDIYDIFVSDFDHFARKYFGHPQYLKVDDRPILYIWASWNFQGSFASAIQLARDRAADWGYDVFIVGEEIRADGFDVMHASQFDGNSAFTFLMPGTDWRNWENVAIAAADVDKIYGQWSDNLVGVQVNGRSEQVNFQPAWAPQYDDRLFKVVNNEPNPIYVPAESQDQVYAMAEVARQHAQPIGNDGQKFIWLNTWNNWAETTTVEPTEALGNKYPAGNYEFDMLEVIRAVFGAETY